MSAERGFQLQSLNFYQNLSTVSDYKKICDLAFYHDAPADWHVIVCDIEKSTQAIKEGKYKEVNFVGAACIMALVNECADVQIPYVFGGDGATAVVPGLFLEKAKRALSSLQELSRESYSLILRVGIVSVQELQREGFVVKIAKQKLATQLSIALFYGNGFSEAERRIKNIDQYLISNSNTELYSPNVIEGLECRWEALDSNQGEILTVLVKAKDNTSFDVQKIYEEVIEEIDVICGAKESVNPASLSNLKLSTDPKKLSVEFRAKSYGLSIFQRFYSFTKLFVEAILGRILFRFNLKFSGVDWGRYQNEVVAQSDYWKFDDCLRFVFDVKAAQKRALQACLENKRREGKLYYGIHSSRSALMTCLIFNRHGQHVHFVDGADGGYAMAAVQLKESMKNY